jgi:hypothetical protein
VGIFEEIVTTDTLGRRTGPRSAAQLSMLLEGIDWRRVERTHDEAKNPITHLRWSVKRYNEKPG